MSKQINFKPKTEAAIHPDVFQLLEMTTDWQLMREILLSLTPESNIWTPDADILIEYHKEIDKLVTLNILKTTDAIQVYRLNEEYIQIIYAQYQ